MFLHQILIPHNRPVQVYATEGQAMSGTVKVVEVIVTYTLLRKQRYTPSVIHRTVGDSSKLPTWKYLLEGG